MANIITNPSFETNTNGWGLDGVYTRSSDDAYDGSYSIKHVSAGNYDNFTTVNDGSGWAVSSSTDYVFSFWKKVDVVSGNAPRLRLADGAAPYANYDITDQDIPDSGGIWEQVIIPFTTGGSTTKVSMRIFNNGGTVNAFYDLFYLDVAPSSSVKKYMGVALEDIKKVNSTAIEDVKKIDGINNV